MLGKKQLINPLWFIIPDFILMFLSLELTLWIKYAEGLPDRALHYKIFGGIFTFWLIVLFVHNLFDFRSLKRYLTLFFNLASAMFIDFLVAVVYFYFQPSLLLTPRRTLLLVVLISFILILIWHSLVRFLLKNKITEDYYLFSQNDELKELEAEVGNHLGLRIIKRIANLNELGPASQVIISKQLLSDSQIIKQIYDFRLKGIIFHNHIEFYERLLGRIPLEHLNELWLVDNIGFHEGKMQVFLRRVIDFFAGLVLLILFIATFLFIAAAIKLNSPGPLFFRQERIGRHGKNFRVYKYRTMTAESSGRGWTSRNDSRITRVGKILRRLHLDELPQFINLLLGNMSIVGPRPEQLEIVSEMRAIIPFYDERHLVKPGITGWSQLNIYASTVEETRRKLEYDLYYLKHRSIWFDLEIILKTLYFIARNKI